MKLLILTTYYPPDTAIAAVRPYMLAKYLSQRGHCVTVLRSGEISQNCDESLAPLPSVRVISYLGENSPAEAYARGQWQVAEDHGKSRIDFLPEIFRLPISRCFHFLTRNKAFDQFVKTRMGLLEKQKAALDSLKGESFDVVFSTVGEFENALAGQYAAELFGAPLIQDFRDQIALRNFQNKKVYAFWKRLQDESVQKADVCTAVSHGVLEDICSGLQVKSPAVLYNGYEPTNDFAKPAASLSKEFSFCYTGQLYGGMRDCTPLLRALKALAEEGRIALEKVRIHYAGKDFAYLHRQADSLGLSEILVDHGYVGREEAAKMQSQADLFLVLSWNTATTKGILTGKFYEGIRAKKPILALVAGDVPGSELRLINEKYRYGFCYENCRESQQFEKLCDYLETAYKEKMELGAVGYAPDSALETDFRYDTLAQSLEKLCLQLLEEKK